MIKILVLLFLMISTVTMAKEWQCTNNEMEIYCASGKCSLNDSFVPMSVSFDEIGSLSICAYSGCWVGKGKVHKVGEFLTLVGHNLKFTPLDAVEMRADFLIALELSDQIAVLKGRGFAMPLSCNQKSMKLQ